MVRGESPSDVGADRQLHQHAQQVPLQGELSSHLAAQRQNLVGIISSFFFYKIKSSLIT